MDMSDALFPLAFGNDEVRLLTALVIGFFFGFALERGGFGNARKLAAQFYLHDMTVFKVMFTAILVAMVGLYTLAAAGWVDMDRVWINPTILWAQVVGGFLLGVGFIMSGLCPGTAVVSAASGRWDGVVTLAGMALGIAGFALAVDAFPTLERLYSAGTMGVSVLPALLGLPTLPFILAIVVMAGSAFIGAEAVERLFRDRRPPLELAPAPRPRAKLAVAGLLGLVLVAGLGLRPTPASSPGPRLIVLEPLAPLALAERIIQRDPDLLVLDLRDAPDATVPDATVPGAYPVADDEAAAAVLAGAGPATDVVLLTDRGRLDSLPGPWPDLRYRLLDRGWVGWEADVLTVATPGTPGTAGVQRQNAIAAFFSGATLQAPTVAPPPAVPATGGGARPRRGGC
jgi:uncharacterized membrane protein YedE/YeeE